MKDTDTKKCLNSVDIHAFINVLVIHLTQNTKPYNNSGEYLQQPLMDKNGNIFTAFI